MTKCQLMPTNLCEDSSQWRHPNPRHQLQVPYCSDIAMLLQVPTASSVAPVARSLAHLPLSDAAATNLLPPTSSKAVIASIALRGGEIFAKHADSVLDISRVRMRLEGLASYATLCALLANGCLRLYSSVKAQDKTADVKKQRAYDAFYFFIVISILSGSYTTVVFTLLALFSKTALGRGYDKEFLKFWSATTGLRESGLEAFLAALVCFEFAFILSLYLRTEGRRRKMLVLLACCLAAFSFARWFQIMRLVSTLLFPIRAEMDY